MPSAPTYSQAEIEQGLPLLKRHRADPIAFMKEILGVEYTWDLMDTMSQSVLKN